MEKLWVQEMEKKDDIVDYSLYSQEIIYARTRDREKIDFQVGYFSQKRSYEHPFQNYSKVYLLESNTLTIIRQNNCQYI